MYICINTSTCVPIYLFIYLSHYLHASLSVSVFNFIFAELLPGEKDPKSCHLRRVVIEDF